MTVETSTTISGLNAAWPLGSDPKSEGDNHLRLIKSVLQAAFDDSGTTLKTTKPIDIGSTPAVVPLTARTKNLLINPAMMSSQENGSTYVTGSGWIADQWSVSTGIATAGGARQSTPLSPNGSVPLMLSITTGKPSLAATDTWQLYQPIEGVNIADLLWGTASAKQVVLQFWARTGNAPGTYTMRISNGASNRCFLAPFTLPSGGVWTLFTIVIPGDTTGTWATDSTQGLAVAFTLAAGTTYQGTAGWQASNVLGITGSTNGAAVNGNSIYFADVGLYADPGNTGLAPAFVIPDIATELVKCQRYWEAGAFGINGYTTAGGYVSGFCQYKATKRIAPTVSGNNTSNANCPATVVADTVSVGSHRSIRQATATGAVGYGENWIANARM